MVIGVAEPLVDVDIGVLAHVGVAMQRVAPGLRDELRRRDRVDRIGADDVRATGTRAGGKAAGAARAVEDRPSGQTVRIETEHRAVFVEAARGDDDVAESARGGGGACHGRVPSGASWIEPGS